MMAWRSCGSPLGPFSSRPALPDVSNGLPPILRSRRFVQLVSSFSPCLAVIIVSRPDDAGRVRIPHHGHAAGRQGANEPQETSRIPIGLIWEHAAPQEHLIQYPQDDKTNEKKNETSKHDVPARRYDETKERRHGDRTRRHPGNANTKKRDEQARRDGETRRPTRRRTRRDENNTSKQRDDRIERTRRPTGRTHETRDETTSGERAHRQPTKEIKHTGKTSNRHIHRPTPSPPTPHRPQASNNPPPPGRRDEQAEKWIASKGFPHPMSDCRHIATCPTSSSNGVNQAHSLHRFVVPSRPSSRRAYRRTSSHPSFYSSRGAWGQDTGAWGTVFYLTQSFSI